MTVLHVEEPVYFPYYLNVVFRVGNVSVDLFDKYTSLLLQHSPDIIRNRLVATLPFEKSWDVREHYHVRTSIMKAGEIPGRYLNCGAI